MGNAIVILTLADGGKKENPFYGKYLTLEMGRCSERYNQAFELIQSGQEQSHVLMLNQTDWKLYVLREKTSMSDSRGFEFDDGDKNSKNSRAEKICQLIKSLKIEGDPPVIIIPHNGIKVQGMPEKATNMPYRTGGNGGTECAWQVVVAIVDACLSPALTLAFESLKNKVEWCLYKKKLRVLTYQVEVLMGIINIECQGKGDHDAISSAPDELNKFPELKREIEEICEKIPVEFTVQIPDFPGGQQSIATSRAASTKILEQIRKINNAILGA